MLKFIVYAMTIFIFVSAVFGQNEKCSHSGWVEDKDPKGTNIRDAPSLKGKIIGNIPHAAEEGEQAMLDIIGYSNGWLKIRLAETVDGAELFNKTGWISAKMVTANVETGSSKPAVLFALPKRPSRKIGTIPNDTPIKIVGFDCFGFKVSYKGKSGWLRADDVCGNPVTTCP